MNKFGLDSEENFQALEKLHSGTTLQLKIGHGAKQTFF